MRGWCINDPPMDLSLDLASPTSATYRDLLVGQGDLVLTSDAHPAGTPFVLQSILQRLRLCLGEWFLNTALGVPYFQLIFVKGASRSQIDNALQACITGTPGVLRLTRYSVVYTSAQRLASIQFTAATTAGQVQYSGPLNSPNTQVSA